MAIYIDPAMWPYRGTFYCHMMTDGSMEELHAFAEKLGLKRRWFQEKPSGNHYDLSANKRRQAIRLGAISVSSRQMLRRCSPRMRRIMDDQLKRPGKRVAWVPLREDELYVTQLHAAMCRAVEVEAPPLEEIERLIKLGRDMGILSNLGYEVMVIERWIEEQRNAQPQGAPVLPDLPQ